MPRCYFCAFFAALTLSASAIPASTIDSINPSATPASLPGNTVEFSFTGNDIGWYYTPTFTYMLNGISTNFSSFSGTLTTPQITIQIQSERPVNGGTVLAQGTFQGNSATGGIDGATFPAVQLTAGTQYFVDLLNMNGMGVDVGTWQTVSGSPAPSGGATTNLGAFYTDSSTTTGFSSAITGSAVYAVSSSGVNLGGGEPILFFSGFIPTPEPSSFILAAIALLGVAGVSVKRWMASN